MAETVGAGKQAQGGHKGKVPTAERARHVVGRTSATNPTLQDERPSMHRWKQVPLMQPEGIARAR
jgi:hypothetical protein